MKSIAILEYEGSTYSYDNETDQMTVYDEQNKDIHGVSEELKNIVLEEGAFRSIMVNG